MRGLRNGLAISGLIGLALVTAGCNAPDTNNANGTAVEDAAKLAAQRQCISHVFSESLLKVSPGGDQSAALNLLRAQVVEGCPKDFTQAFVDARNAVTTVVDAQAELDKHVKQYSAALGEDAAKRGCDLIIGNCPGGQAVAEWQRRKEALTNTFDEAVSAERRALAKTQSVAAAYGVVIKWGDGSPAKANIDGMETTNDSMLADDSGNAM